MFWDHYGMGWGWSWVWLLLPILLVVAAVVVVIVLLTNRSDAAHHPGPPPGHRAAPHVGTARAIAAERLARGEITPDEYREIVRALDETPRPPGG